CAGAAESPRRGSSSAGSNVTPESTSASCDSLVEMRPRHGVSDRTLELGNVRTVAETQKEQTDRQLIELLTELRVALPGGTGAARLPLDGTVSGALHPDDSFRAGGALCRRPGRIQVVVATPRWRGVAVGRRRGWGSEQTGRPVLRSPGRPPVGRCEHRQRF